jgi:hypothetical protein
MKTWLAAKYETAMKMRQSKKSSGGAAKMAKSGNERSWRRLKSVGGSGESVSGGEMAKENGTRRGNNAVAAKVKLKAQMKAVSNEIGERGWRRQRGAGDGLPGGWRCERLEKRLAVRRRESAKW